MKVNLITLGCPKNLVDSEFLQGGLQQRGVEFVAAAAEAEAIIVNTCGFVASAKEESIDTILQALALKKQGVCRQVFVTGCLSERYGPELRRELPEVDGFYGNRDLRQIVNGLALQMRLKHNLLGEGAAAAERALLTPRHYAYLKISEGCEHPCTFCAIPQIRGAFRSTPLPTLVAQAQQLAARGVKELILVAQDSTQYGLDLNGRQQLPALLEALHAVDGLAWIRVMYAYPHHVNDAIIRALAGLPRVVKYLDLPIQHISDRMLKRMARRVNRRFTEELIDRLQAAIPNLVLRTSLITGFPGETEEDFQSLYDFVCAGHFARLGVFTYSQEENTPAYAFADQVPEEVKRERYDLLVEAQRQVAWEWNQRQIGRELQVLIEEYDEQEQVYRGRTEWDCPEIDHVVVVPAGRGQLPLGEFCRVRITGAGDFELTGRALNLRGASTPAQRRLPVVG
ncbi:MAG: 30S ribosomal protein S12 methylthiotransferase RimO [candidate division KSB1 bacterium]|nr:30S ribosomal protein S12 methylthiotransferase RimO [candidate division KSB1 bacterium]MDZ7276025.1 30S ribosomal protein S12 methylthiotransferase RimO [candidate division KSB1 bacterium]MDZ7285693.1 30S ribosomal protein S12 methylthiotransferase RimO [candidate division KSB1 bacterium]MDZ7298725.1 30S ribosomal protein S12 methylthiotransferase RimO [candidate division KSB1 bacterium]MDZ7309546.1 30S ribosomal protein S12 methylthiotransferase RimO [candidate division KSB1 bacterium]